MQVLHCGKQACCHQYLLISMIRNNKCSFCILASKHAVMHLAQLNYVHVAMTRFVSQQLRSSPEEEEADH